MLPQVPYFCDSLKAMQEVVIQYRNPKVLEVLRSISELFGFKVLTPRRVKEAVPAQESEVAEPDQLNGVTIIPASGKLTSGGLADIFKGVDARKLREEAWTRNR